MKAGQKYLKVKQKHKTTFFSPSENWFLPAPSTIKPEEREFVVDSGASMHMISKKDLNSAELETVTTSRSPTTVFTANGEVQTHEEATVYVKELDIFLTMKVLEDTPAVLSLGKLCDEHGYSYEWMNGQKPHLIQNDLYWHVHHPHRCGGAFRRLFCISSTSSLTFFLGGVTTSLSSASCMLFARASSHLSSLDSSRGLSVMTHMFCPFPLT